jgi:hypothetical protein
MPFGARGLLLRRLLLRSRLALLPRGPLALAALMMLAVAAAAPTIVLRRQRARRRRRDKQSDQCLAHRCHSSTRPATIRPAHELTFT